MPVKPEREYRAAIEFRVADLENYIVEGYATTFDEPYELEGCGGEKEIILRSALDDADMSDVIFQFDHRGMVMARTRNNTLSLFADEHGLGIRADLSGTQRGRELAEAIANGLVDRMSWGFMVAEGGYEFDFESRTCTITKISKVYDVSAVSIPANQGTDIQKRSAFLDGAIEAAKQELLVRKANTRAQLALKAKSIVLEKGMTDGIPDHGSEGLSRP